MLEHSIDGGPLIKARHDASRDDFGLVKRGPNQDDKKVARLAGPQQVGHATQGSQLARDGVPELSVDMAQGLAVAVSHA